MTWQETIAEGEQDTFERYAQELREMQEARARGREHFRGLHTKAHVGAVGTLEVLELPEALRVGPFATPRTWPVYTRFSNGQPGSHPDAAPDIRGLALKLVGVPGKKLIPGLEDAPTQDFLFIHTPATAVRDPHEFLALIRAARAGRAGMLPRMWRSVGFFRTFAILRAFLGGPKVRSMATAPFYTAVPLRFGDHAAKLALIPSQHDAHRAPKGRDGLRDDLIARLAAGPLFWTLVVQLWVDEHKTPIEDASVRWREEDAPFQPLARLVLPRQDVMSEAGQAAQRTIESLSFDPWHAVPELRPIGAMMRARAPAYRESVLARGAAPEPSTVLPAG